MKTKLTLAAAAAAIAVVGATPATSQAADCGTLEDVTIAEMTWLSASALAHIAKTVLDVGYGCEVKIVPGDTVPTATSMMTKSEPMIAPELWLPTAETIWEKAQSRGGIYKAGDVFSAGGEEGWWIPDYVAEANPGLKSVTDLKDYKDLFVEASSGGKARFYGCPPGWGCEINNINYYKALDLDSHGFELFSPGSGANLKAAIARKVTRKEPIVAYYWGPTDVIGKYNLVKLDMGPYDADKFKCITDKDCENPQLTGWKSGEVAMAVVDEVKEKAPSVAEFLSKMQVSNGAISAALAWGDDNSASGEEVAEFYFENYADEWTTWVSDDIAAKVKAAL